ncbi:protein of unknown function [Agreia sp. COWG]|nr:protein of unknown function [Agreia sp. COWG]
MVELRGTHARRDRGVPHRMAGRGSRPRHAGCRDSALHEHARRPLLHGRPAARARAADGATAAPPALNRRGPTRSVSRSGYDGSTVVEGELDVGERVIVVVRLEFCDVEDDQRVDGLRHDVRNRIAGLLQHPGVGTGDVQQGEQVGDRIDAPAQQEQEAQPPQGAADRGWLIRERLAQLHEEHEQDVCEGDRREDAEESAHPVVATDLARITEGDHEPGRRYEAHEQLRLHRPRQREHRHELHQQQRHRQKPVHVAVALIECRAGRLRVVARAADRRGDEGTLEGIEDAEVVVRGDAADDDRDRDGLPVAGQDTRERDEQENRGEQLRRDHERQEVVDRFVLTVRQSVWNHDALLWTSDRSTLDAPASVTDYLDTKMFCI